LTLSSAIRAYGIGAFANNLLPTGFGGDAVRAWLVARRGRPLVRSLTSVAVDRATALACLLILAWVGVAISPDSIPTGLTVLLGAATLIGSLGAIAMIAALRRRGLGRFLPEPLRPWTREVAETLRGYGRDRGLTVRAAVLGLAFQASIITATWMLAKALGLRLDPPILAVVVPLVLIATLVPISIAGFGVREAAFVGLLGEVGTSSADAVVLSLMAVTSLAIASLPGGLALVLGHVHLETPHEVLEDVSRPGAEAASPASLRGAGGDEVA
jgi:uncharacterized membrane protein YbhN (UPF0104 family)